MVLIDSDRVYRGDLYLYDDLYATNALFVKKGDNFIFVGDYMKTAPRNRIFVGNNFVKQNYIEGKVWLHNLRWDNALLIKPVDEKAQATIYKYYPHIERSIDFARELMEASERTFSGD